MGNQGSKRSKKRRPPHEAQHPGRDAGRRDLNPLHPGPVDAPAAMAGIRSRLANQTGIPGPLKAEAESRGGVPLDDVRVHYNSDRPQKLGALAYAQGSQVHIAPGQERHLQHELGHVIQQKKGLVEQTGKAGGLPANRDPRLEAGAAALNAPQAKPGQGEAARGGGIVQMVDALSADQKALIPDMTEVNARYYTAQEYCDLMMQIIRLHPDAFAARTSRELQKLVKLMEAHTVEEKHHERNYRLDEFNVIANRLEAAPIVYSDIVGEYGRVPANVVRQVVDDKYFSFIDKITRALDVLLAGSSQGQPGIKDLGGGIYELKIYGLDGGGRIYGEKDGETIVFDRVGGHT